MTGFEPRLHRAPDIRGQHFVQSSGAIVDHAYSASQISQVTLENVAAGHLSAQRRRVIVTTVLYRSETSRRGPATIT